MCHCQKQAITCSTLVDCPTLVFPLQHFSLKSLTQFQDGPTKRVNTCGIKKCGYFCVMGCPVSKDITVAPLGSVPAISSSFTGKHVDAKNLHIPLSEREIFTLTQSWKGIGKNMIRIGMDMFLKFDPVSIDSHNYCQSCYVPSVAECSRRAQTFERCLNSFERSTHSTTS